MTPNGERFRQLIDCYHLDPETHAVELFTVAMKHFQEVPGRPSIGPWAGAIGIASERLDLRCRILSKIVYWVFVIFFRDIPGWNDYYMIRWLLTHSNEDLKEIAARTERNDIVGNTARWMVASMCNQLPEFEKAAKESPFRFWGVPISQEPQCK